METARAAMQLTLVLVALFQIVGAVNIIAYPKLGACRGTGLAFKNIPPGRCVPFRNPAGSVLFVNVRACEDSNVYRGGDRVHLCARRHRVGSRRGSTCFTRGRYSGANFLRTRCGSPPFEEDVQTSECSELQAQNPTAVVYTEDASEGHWMLTTTEATEVLAEMSTLPEDEKSAWLQARGATFVATTDEEIDVE